MFPGAVAFALKFCVMDKSTYLTLCRAQSAAEADQFISQLRRAGLHPVDSPLSSHVSPGGEEVFFPIQVPAEEADAAKELLDSYAAREGRT